MQYGRTALFNDFAFLPIEFDHLEFSKNTFSVELKPKQGWRPFKEQIHDHCFFCMNQYLKVSSYIMIQSSFFLFKTLALELIPIAFD